MYAMCLIFIPLREFYNSCGDYSVAVGYSYDHIYIFLGLLGKFYLSFDRVQMRSINGCIDDSRYIVGSVYSAGGVVGGGADCAYNRHDK